MDPGVEPALSESAAASESRQNRLLSALPWLLVAVAVVIHLDANRFADPDLFMLLYTGRDIVTAGAIPSVDTASFSAYGQPNQDHEWLSRSIFYALQAHFGGAGLVVLRGLVALAIAGLFWAHARRHSRGLLVYTLCMGVFAVLMLEAFWFRVRLFTFLAIPALLLLIELARTGRPRALWLAAPLFALWVNLHPGFALGIAILGALATESVVVWAAERFRSGAALPIGSASRSRPVPLGTALGSLAVCVLVTGLNPYGAGAWLPLVQSLGSPNLVLITEWRSLLSLPFLAMLPYYALLLGGVLALFFGRHRTTLFDWLVILPMAAAALNQVRFLPLFLIVSVPLLLRTLPGTGLRAAGREPFALLERYRLPLSIAAAAGLALGIFRYEGHTDLAVHKREQFAPVAGVRFLQENGIGGRILNEYDWGGYIRFELPESQIFVDGRFTIYPSEVIGDWARFTNSPDPNGIARKYDADLIFVRSLHPVVRSLAQDPRWIRTYADPVSSIFLRDSPRNAVHLERLRAGETKPPALAADDYLL
jgi:hypothetical protein